MMQKISSGAPHHSVMDEVVIGVVSVGGKTCKMNSVEE